ncbi:MAG: hypothetical protein L0206_19160 [Actinobacteria bacterium]|nr:hypothetical protein [Actinomycetota bacterium]
MELSDWRRWWRERGEDELRTLLMTVWNPIGVKDDLLAADEYDSYILPLAGKLRERASAEDIAPFLDDAEVHITGNEPPRNAAVADQIVQWYADSIRYFAKPS